MRVISGEARGHKLKAPAGLNTRPTTDRVKEAVFSMISEYILNACVLDLFAGSGALGIEALSRGAGECVFIDNDAESVKTVKLNLTKTGLINKAKIYKNNYENALEILIKKDKKFDIVFLDPPYYENFLIKTLKILSNSDIISNEGIIVAEHLKKDTEINIPEQFTIDRKKRYGDTEILIIKKSKGQEI
jgi:16S rRNA (guanine966-N2)-methyltransferase